MNENTLTERSSQKLTPAFALVQAPFWATYCISVSFAAVYLQALGYSNRQLGLILAAGCLMSALLGPLLSSRIDRSPTLTAARLAPFVLAAQAASLLLLIFFPHKGLPSALGFLLYLAFSNSVNSLNLKLYSDAVYGGAAIDYGFCRGIGSLGYVVVSVLVGFAVKLTSALIIPWAGLLLTVLQYLTFRRFHKAAPESRAVRERKRGATLTEFARANPRFCLLLLGTVLMFIAHNAAGNFMINVVRNLGGDEGTLGWLNGFMAAVEIPMMFLYSRLFRKKGAAGAALSLSFVFLTLKAAGIAAAATVPQLAAVFLLQAPSFALYTAAIVPYVAETVAYEDSAKAQSLAYTMTTVGSVLASLIAGPMYDALSVSATLWISCALCAAGTVIALISVKR
ncbi:MAG: MFS transporter [Firmicutes bacterium]|nr:MFS transporter [Bacillota bacterium]